MPKVTYEFDMYEDKSERETFEAARDLLSALEEFRNWMRNYRKHGEGITPAERKFFSDLDEAAVSVVRNVVWDKFWEIVDDNGVDKLL